MSSRCRCNHGLELEEMPKQPITGEAWVIVAPRYLERVRRYLQNSIYK